MSWEETPDEDIARAYATKAVRLSSNGETLEDAKAAALASIAVSLTRVTELLEKISNVRE